RPGLGEVHPLGMGDAHGAVADGQLDRFAGVGGAGHPVNVPSTAGAGRVASRPRPRGSVWVSGSGVTGSGGQEEPTTPATASATGVSPDTSSSTSPAVRGSSS